MPRLKHVDVHQGKPRWNRGGVAPDGIEELIRVAKLVKPDAVVWKGDSSLPRMPRNPSSGCTNRNT